MEELELAVRAQLELGLWTKAVEHSFLTLEMMDFKLSEVSPNDSVLNDWGKLVTSQCYSLLHLSQSDFEELMTKISWKTDHPALEAWALGKLAISALESSLSQSDFLLPRAFDLSILVGESLLLFMSQCQDTGEKSRWLYAAFRNFQTDTGLRMRKLAERFADSRTLATRFTSTLYSLSLCFGQITVAKKLKQAFPNESRMTVILELVDEMKWNESEILPRLVENWSDSTETFPQWIAARPINTSSELEDPLSETTEKGFYVEKGLGQSSLGSDSETGGPVYAVDDSYFCGKEKAERPDVHKSAVRIMSSGMKVQESQKVKLFDFSPPRPIEASQLNSPSRDNNSQPIKIEWTRKQSTKLRGEERSWSWTLHDPPAECFDQDSHTELFNAKGTVKDADIRKLWTVKKRRKNPSYLLENRVLTTNLKANTAYHACIYAYKMSDQSWTYRRLLVEILQALKLDDRDKGASRDVIEFDLDFWIGGLFTEQKRSYVAKRYRRQRSSYLYLNDVKTHQIARTMVDAFNTAIAKLGLRPRLKMLPVWHVQIFEDVDVTSIIDYVNVEPKMHGSYVKFTNNYDYVNSDLHRQILDLMTTFSHFSYDTSERKFMVTDLQGWLPDGPTGDVLLTDPAINTHEGSLNFTDIAEDGLAAFWEFQHRECSDLCKTLGLKRPTAYGDNSTNCSHRQYPSEVN